MSLNTEVNSQDGTPTVLARVAEGDKAMKEKIKPGEAYQYPRRGRREVAGLSGEEFFLTVQGTDDKGKLHREQSEFEYGGRSKNPYKPYLRITFSTGIERVQSKNDSLGDWNNMLHSVQIHH